MGLPLNGIVRMAAVLALGAGAAACDRGPATSSEFNNSGASAIAAMGTGSRNETPQPANPPPNIRPAQIDHAAAPPPDANAASTAGAADGANAANAGSAGNATNADTTTTTQVKAALAADPSLRDADIAVSTQGGTVTLTGTVKDPQQAQHAQDLAQRAPGVSRVENQLAAH